MHNTTKEVVEKFNFRKLHDEMKKKKRRCNFNGEERLPTERELRAGAAKLVDEAISKGGCRTIFGWVFEVMYDGGEITLSCATEGTRVRPVSRHVNTAKRG